jgi:hypothetical protein
LNSRVKNEIYIILKSNFNIMFNIKNISTLIGGSLLFLYKEDIKQLLAESYRLLMDQICHVITIKERNSKLLYGLKCELDSKFLSDFG